MDKGEEQDKGGEGEAEGGKQEDKVGCRSRRIRKIRKRGRWERRRVKEKEVKEAKENKTNQGDKVKDDKQEEGKMIGRQEDEQSRSK